MKILVFAHQLEVGGTQVNAIELSAALRDHHGHDVCIFASPGPMAAVLETKRLRYIPAPVVRSYPSRSMITALSATVRGDRPDVVHAWDWWQCSHAIYATYTRHRIPLVVTDMMSVGGIEQGLPKSPITTFGTPERADWARAAGFRDARVLLPPVDVIENRPGLVDPRHFRDRFEIRDDEIALVTVSRLDRVLKFESLKWTIDAMRALGREFPLRLVIVGDGEGRSDIQKLADGANRELAREAIVLAGQMLDPRPAYAGADIVVGMGGSALRAMAFAKPVVIVGGKGFAVAFTPETSDWFHYHGIYGVGDGSPKSAHSVEALRMLATSHAKRAALGAFSRNFVEAHFSIQAVAEQLNACCLAAVSRSVHPLPAVLDGLRTAAVLSARNVVPKAIRESRMVRSVGRAVGVVSPRAADSSSDASSAAPGSC